MTSAFPKDKGTVSFAGRLSMDSEIEGWTCLNEPSVCVYAVLSLKLLHVLSPL